MEALTPLFQGMLSGVHRLEAQVRAEKELAEEAAAAYAAPACEAEPQAKKRKTHADLSRYARRLVVRLASMANRCYWLSCSEAARYLLTGGDCSQTRNHQRLFARQLHWAMHECKRALNGEATEHGWIAL